MTRKAHSTMDNTANLRPDLAPTALADEMRIYRGVRSRRSMAFIADCFAILLLSIPAALVIGVLGVVTLSLGWVLYAFLFPGVAILYIAFTLGGAAQSTPGMRLFGIRLARLDGGRIDAPLAVLHAVLFWASFSFINVFVYLFPLFSERKQMLHDMLLGTVAVRRNA